MSIRKKSICFLKHMLNIKKLHSCEKSCSTLMICISFKSFVHKWHENVKFSPGIKEERRGRAALKEAFITQNGKNLIFIFLLWIFLIFLLFFLLNDYKLIKWSFSVAECLNIRYVFLFIYKFTLLPTHSRENCAKSMPEFITSLKLE